MANITFLPKDAPRLGDYAEDRYGRTGRIYQVHHSCPESKNWIRAQATPVTEEELGERWLSMLVYPAGAVVGPASSFTKIRPIPEFYLQRDAADYFTDCVTDETKYVDLRERRHNFSL